MPTLAVTKVQGTGNDFVLIDNPRGAAHDYPALARFLCDRRFGVGADGLLVLLPPASEDADAALRIFNADGSEAESCGNGLRCVARYIAQERGEDEATITVSVAGGPACAVLLPGDLVRIEMGRPIVDDESFQVEALGRQWACRAVSVGNPHCVVLIEGDPSGVDLPAVAGAIEQTGRFPEGVNVEIARFENGVAQMRVRERGVGETWACGTGACAVAGVGIVTGKAASPVAVTQLGGSVTVAWTPPAGTASLTGPAQIVFRTIVEVPAGLLASDARVATSA
jgi:diaminopimelate epimerase